MAADEPKKRRQPPATTPEARERQMIALAYDLVEERLANKTATSQETTHFLKLGSSREVLEQERITHENRLLEAKREAIQSAARVEELMINALDAMKSYKGAEDRTYDD